MTGPRYMGYKPDLSGRPHRDGPRRHIAAADAEGAKLLGTITLERYECLCVEPVAGGWVILHMLSPTSDIRRWRRRPDAKVELA